MSRITEELREAMHYTNEYSFARDFVFKECCDSIDASSGQLQAENAKLRKELTEIYAIHWNGLDCTECPWFDECDTTGGCPWLSILADHMRELGVEVDG